MFAGAVKNLETAMSLAGLRPGHERSNVSSLSGADKASLYLELSSAYAGLRKFDEARLLVEDMRSQLSGTTEEARAVIGSANLSLQMNEVDRAIELLNSIAPGESYYLQAHTKLAEIYLNRRMDRHSFAKCFRDLVENCPGPETYSMLGDAYLAIQEPERAIEAYELSLKSNPADKILAKKMGAALVKTHQYAKAINYYKEAVKQEGCRDLKLDMAELFMKLKQYEKAEDTLLEELNGNIS